MSIGFVESYELAPDLVGTLKDCGLSLHSSGLVVAEMEGTPIVCYPTTGSIVPSLKPSPPNVSDSYQTSS